jgi:cytoskeletal protein RodZ
MKLFGYNITVPGRLSFGQPDAPESDWQVATISSLVLLVVFLLVSGWLFWQVRSGQFGSQEDTKTTLDSTVLNKEALDQATARYERLRSRYELLKDNQPDISNPAR